MMKAEEKQECVRNSTSVFVIIVSIHKKVDCRFSQNNEKHYQDNVQNHILDLVIESMRLVNVL